MTKKTKSKKITSANPPPPRLEKEIKEDAKKLPEDENSKDFGGIPNRDLKKNLGCG